MKNSLLIALCLIAYFSVAAFGNWQRWKPDTVTGTTTVHDTLQGPVITIVTPDSVAYDADWKFKASVTWRDGEYAEVSCYVRLDDTPYNIMPVGYLRATLWDGVNFSFGNDAYANLMFRDEADDSLEFTVYAVDDNGMSDVATKTVVYYLP